MTMPATVEIRQAGPERLLPLADPDDGGRRYAAFWARVDSSVPDEPLWFLDLVGVAGHVRGRGIAGALIRVVEAADAPDGEPRIWFMRWSPTILAR